MEWGLVDMGCERRFVEKHEFENMFILILQRTDGRIEVRYPIELGFEASAKQM
jgi:hypothetical protein